MVKLIFRNSCRACNRALDIDGLITDSEKDLEYYKKLSDYEVSQQIEETLKRNKYDCQFCGANNWNIENIRVNNYHLFDIKSINKKYSKKYSFVFQFELIMKNGRGSHTTGNATNPDLNSGIGKALFEHRCKDEIKKIINSIPDSKCVHHQDAYLFFFFTGNRTEIKLEMFRHIGILKKNMIQMIDNSLRSSDDSMFEIGY